jgi:hypothetical protein
VTGTAGALPIDAMTRAEAAELLGVHDTSTPDAILRRYEELHNDFQIRLTNAPTPTLKKTYQRSLQELDAAVDLLVPGRPPAVPDLPSAEPVGADPGFRPPPRVGPNRADGRPRAADPAAASAGLPRSTMLALAVAALFAAGAAYLVITRAQLLTQDAAVRRELDRQSGQRARLEATYGSLPFADTIRIRNASKESAKVTALSLTYLDEQGHLKTAHSGTFGYPTWEIRPGQSVRLDREVGRGQAWNGPVLFYAMLVEYPGAEPFLKAGTWTADIDAIDKVLVLDLD